MARILVVDDSAFMRKFLREALETLGHEVDDLLPISPLEITERIRANRPDLVLSDYHMPHVDGLQVARMVRRADAAIPVVMLTSVRDPAVDAALATLGVRRILHKPMSGEAIAKAIQEILGN
jgi:two-component system chemotaxis response regulator CheY